MKLRIGLALLLPVAIVAVVAVLLNGTAPVDEGDDLRPDAPTCRQPVPPGNPAKSPLPRTRPQQQRPQQRPRPAAPAQLPPSQMSGIDKSLCDVIQRALDNDDFEIIHEAVDAALQTGNVEVRRSMVEALGWFGSRAIGDLRKFIGDSDADVREIARNNWQFAISEVDDESTKAKLIEESVSVLDDEDAIDTLAGELNGMDEKIAIETIVRIMANGDPKGVKAAKESYQFITGDEWKSPGSARAWLSKNYSP